MKAPGKLELANAKKALRPTVRARRAGASAAAPDAASRVLRNFIAAVPLPPGAVISGYWPVEHELDVRPLLEHAHSRGHRLGLPVVVGRRRPLTFRVWAPGEALVDGRFGIPTPPADAPEVVPGLLLVPMLAFDDAGYRLGYGGGFYDRTLARLRALGPATVAVGVAFAAQRVDRVPHHDHDQPLDWIVTEKDAIRFPAPTDSSPPPRNRTES